MLVPCLLVHGREKLYFQVACVVWFPMPSDMFISGYPCAVLMHWP